MEVTKELFNKAVDFVKDAHNGKDFKADNTQKLQFYALYKQAANGSCTGLHFLN